MVVGLFAIIAVSYLALRQLCMMERTRIQAPAVVFALGAASWVFIVSVAALALYAIYLFYALLVLGSFAAMTELLFTGLMAGLAVRANEALDTALVFHYLRSAALFQPLQPRSVLLQDELEKKRIHDIHRLSSDKPFPRGDTEKRLLTRQEIERYQNEAREATQRPKRSVRFDEEIQSLKAGIATTLADPWKVYTFDHKHHDWYEEMSGLLIDPRSRTLRFKLNVPRADETALHNPLYVFQVKQDLYQLLQVLNTDPWILWYGEYFDYITTTCFGIESDSFGQTQMYPFLRITVSRRQLSEREGKFFNAADIHKIAELTFNNGDPIPDEPL